MGAEALVLPDASVVASDAFKRQSVTSERWLQILQVWMVPLDGSSDQAIPESSESKDPRELQSLRFQFTLPALPID